MTKKQLSLSKPCVFAFLVLALLSSVFAVAQEKKPLASPRDSVSGKIGKATVTINYGSPSVKGRQIWGALVPMDSVWRAGANEATTFSTDQDVTIEGQALPAGKYALFAIPSANQWTIIFNKVAKQWGAYKYDASQDALRITVKPRKSATMHERLKYVINKKGFALQWENLEVPVSVK